MKKLLLLVAAVLIVGVGYLALKGTPVNELTVLSWDYYIGPTTIADFEEEHHAKVTYEMIKSNEEAMARIKANPGVYDVIVLTDYAVDTLRNEGGLMKLDLGALSNAKNIAESFKGGYFDPGMEYSVPYAYGTTGFAVNRAEIPDVPITWKELTKPEYKGKVAIMDDMRYVLGSVLMELGYSPNTVNPKEIDAAVALLQAVMPNVVKFTSASPVDLMVSGGALVGYSWSGDALQMQEENAEIAYEIPAYGTLKFFDNMVILADAPHREAAHAYIDFILRPDVSAAITDEIQYGNPNVAAIDLIAEDVRSNPAVFPAPEAMAKLQFITEVGDDLALYEKAWEKMKQ
jgi:spermidine/putrescine transport system substrate-binding protein